MDQGAEAIKRFRLKNAFGTELGECAWLRAALFARWIGGDCENEACGRWVWRSLSFCFIVEMSSYEVSLEKREIVYEVCFELTSAH